MTKHGVLEMLQGLYGEEERLRRKSVEHVERNGKLKLYLSAVENVMNLAYVLRQFPTDDEDMKLIQILGMRMFNAFGSCTKLGLSGYNQNSALIMRDVLETVFLLDWFKDNKNDIERWRLADRRERMKHFSPLRVREALDARDGFTEKKRAKHYELLSELAAHPTMSSVLMMRPQQDGDAVIGPFIESTTLEAVLAELGRLAIQGGEVLDHFFPETWNDAVAARAAFSELKLQWIDVFYTETATENSSPAIKTTPS